MLLFRIHFDIENPQEIREITLLIMQARQVGDVDGIKLLTVAPQLIAAHASVRRIKTVYVWGEVY